MQRLGAGVITTDADLETLAFDWGTVRMLSEPQVTGAQPHSFGMVKVLPGGHERHNHPGAEEIIYVVSGEGEQMVDDQPPVKIGPGACVSFLMVFIIQHGIYHSTLNTGSEPMQLIIIYAPAGPEQMLREIPGCRVLAPGEN